MKQVTWKPALLLLTTVVTLQGCKKGENDPFISLKSRDARITGEWELTKMESTGYSYYKSDDSQAYAETRTRTFDGTQMTYSTKVNFDDPEYVDIDTTYTHSYSRVIVIDKNGNFKETFSEDGGTDEVTGNWWWLNDKKKKTRIAFDDDWDSFDIDRLKNNELILKQEFTYNGTDSLGVKDEASNAIVLTFKKK
jgi:hypothetical protein